MKIKKAIILCAGYGKRLQPLTSKTPKPLLKINKKTLLENTINLLKKFGIKEVFINTHHLSDKIVKFIDKNNFNLKIQIITKKKAILGTGGGISNITKNVKEELFLVINPDTIWNTRYLKTLQSMEKIFFKKNCKNILLMVHKSKSFDKNLKGDFEIKHNLIKESELKNNFIFTGVQILNKKVFKDIKKRKFQINNVWQTLIKKKKLYGFESKLKFFHVTDFYIYKKLKKKFKY